MTGPRRVLLVDDDTELLAVLGDRLRRDGYQVTEARSGMEALDRLDAGWPDLVLLDLTMPTMDGNEVAAEIKRRADIPIIVLSAVTGAETRTQAISRYAEDYVTKPFDYPELVARLDRVMRRLGDRLPGDELRLGPDLTFVLRRRTAIVGGRMVAISPTETRFVATLAAQLGTTVSTETILDRVWSASEGADPSLVWVTARRIRRKIELDPDNPRYLLTDRQGGYRLAAVE